MSAWHSPQSHGVVLAMLLVTAACDSKQPVVYIDKTPAAAAERPKLPAASWKVKANWRQLERGMTKREVSKLLGEPTDVTVLVSGNTLWRWSESSCVGTTIFGTREYGPYTCSTLSGRMEFNANGKLISWKEI